MVPRLMPIDLSHLSFWDQVLMLHDLLPFIHHFALSIADVGCVRGHLFSVDLKHDRTF